MEPITRTDSHLVPNGFGGFVTRKNSSYKDQTEMKSGRQAIELAEKIYLASTFVKYSLSRKDIPSV
jgi:hypothetical protein